MKFTVSKVKACWIATETKKGWRLGFAIGNKPTHWLRPTVYFASRKEIEKVSEGEVACVFVYLKDTKEKIK